MTRLSALSSWSFRTGSGWYGCSALAGRLGIMSISNNKTLMGNNGMVGFPNERLGGGEATRNGTAILTVFLI